MVKIPMNKLIGWIENEHPEDYKSQMELLKELLSLQTLNAAHLPNGADETVEGNLNADQSENDAD